MSKELTFNQKIVAIQSELKAPKNQFNKFGKYKYRSCEDILEGVKPLLKKYNLMQTIEDNIVQIGERYYIAAKVIVIGDGTERSVTAFAREPKSKKGMDESQITGTASSYARKYALNGMWLIDDTKDADTDEHHKQKERKKPVMNSKNERWEPAVHSLAKGEVTIDKIKKKFTLSDKDAEKMIAEAKDFKNEH